MRREFWALWSADFLLRGSYQLGKTPVLPILAASLGAGEVVVGLVVSASTCTGIVAKPLFGWLSDLWGRRRWLWAALGLFVAMPFAYPLLATPEQLLGLRTAHGMATAILGPVTLSWVVAMSEDRRASRLGTFGMARGFAHLLAPTVAGLLLLVLEPVEVFPVVGALSLLAAAPLMMLGPSPRPPAARRPEPVRAVWRKVVAVPALWCAGGIETMVYLATYAARAFLPLAVLQHPEGSVVLAGVFFTVQETVHLLTRPLGGRFADRWGVAPAIVLGMGMIGVGMMGLSAVGGLAMLACAAIAGAGQGMVLPASMAMAGGSVPQGMTGTGMGVYGALRNAGKVAGPVVAGLLAARYGIEWMFMVMAVLIVTGAGLVAVGNWSRRILIGDLSMLAASNGK